MRSSINAMNNIKIFNDSLFGKVRGYLDGDMPWLCLADVCAALGIANNRDAVARLKKEGVGKTDTPTESGRQEMTFINEPNLYRLILRNNKPQAEKFIDWVTGDVLPTLRKTGGYGAGSFAAAGRKEDYRDPLTNAIAKDVWAAVDRVYLRWIRKAQAQEALAEFKKRVGRA